MAEGETKAQRIIKNVLIGFGAFGAGLIVAIVATRNPLDPLTPELLSAARDRWRSAGIENYDLRYSQHGSNYDVRVRGGVVVDASVDGQAPQNANLGDLSMDGLLRVVQMECDALTDESGPFASGSQAVIARVRFHPELGYLQRYLRSGGGFGQSAAIDVEFFAPITSDTPTAP